MAYIVVGLCSFDLVVNVALNEISVLLFLNALLVPLHCSFHVHVAVHSLHVISEFSELLLSHFLLQM